MVPTVYILWVKNDQDHNVEKNLRLINDKVKVEKVTKIN